MAVPKRRTSKTVKNQRRTHKKLQAPNMTACPNCSEMKLNHRVCSNCGFYKDRVVVEN